MKEMKKYNLLLIVIMTVISISGCGSEKEESSAPEKTITVSSPSPSVSELLDEKTSSSYSSEVQEESSTIASTDTPDYSALDASQQTDEVVLSTIEGVDIDLSSLSSTVVYAQVYRMMYYPEEFVGKTIRMEGLYSDFLDEATGKHYYACIIQDATACCAQGVEFEPVDSYSYPDDYPSDGDTVVVEGVFDVYQEGEFNYCTLRDAEFK